MAQASSILTERTKHELSKVLSVSPPWGYRHNHFSFLQPKENGVTIMNTLEHRIAKALSDNEITSARVADLLNETEQASIDADAAAVTAREVALDPIASPDANKARAAIEDTNFACMRLRTVLPRLQTKYDKVHRNERYIKWAVEHSRVVIKRDAAAEKLRKLYPEIEAKLVELLLEIESVDQEVRLINNAGGPFLQDATNEEKKRYPQLKTVELTARGLEHFGPNDLSIMNDLKIPMFAQGPHPAWPPYRPVDWSHVTPSYPRRTANWAAEDAQRREGQRHG
jgi:hypothetical protein